MSQHWMVEIRPAAERVTPAITDQPLSVDEVESGEVRERLAVLPA
jgi:hypothetical protein